MMEKKRGERGACHEARGGGRYLSIFNRRCAENQYCQTTLVSDRRSAGKEGKRDKRKIKKTIVAIREKEWLGN